MVGTSRSAWCWRRLRWLWISARDLYAFWSLWRSWRTSSLRRAISSGIGRGRSQRSIVIGHREEEEASTSCWHAHGVDDIEDESVTSWGSGERYAYTAFTRDAALESSSGGGGDGGAIGFEVGREFAIGGFVTEGGGDTIELLCGAREINEDFAAWTEVFEEVMDAGCGDVHWCGWLVRIGESSSGDV